MVGPAHPTPMDTLGRTTPAVLKLLINKQLCFGAGAAPPRVGPVGGYEAGLSEILSCGGGVSIEPPANFDAARIAIGGK